MSVRIRLDSMRLLLIENMLCSSTDLGVYIFEALFILVSTFCHGKTVAANVVRFGPRDEGFRCRKESASIVGLYLPSMAVAMQVMYVVQNMSFWMNSLI